MRVTTADRVVSAEPGSTVVIPVDVVNTGTIIDGLSARIIGLDAAHVRCVPERLPLFPDAEGRLDLVVTLPETQQAGRHPLTAEVVSRSTGAVAHVDVELDVAPRPAVTLRATPRMVRARRSGRFVLEVGNSGNVPLDVSLTSPPAERGVSTRLTPPTLRLEPGAVGASIAVVRGPRMFTGAVVDRTVQVEIGARRLDLAGPEDVEQASALGAATTLQLRQRPLVSRGLLTAGILMTIIGLWAAVFLLGLTEVFSGDDVPKTAPASYFPPDVPTSGDARAAAAIQPAGALSRSGLVPPGVGGQISGFVTATSDGSPVGRILVDAYRRGRGGKLVAVSSSATQADGSYTLAGLFPTEYLLRFSADGFRTTWFKAGKDGAPAPRAATEVAPTRTGDDSTGVVIDGLRGTFTGVVDPGDSLGEVPVEVTVRMLTGQTPFTKDVTTTAGGRYRIDDLPAPGTYELSFRADGYQVATVVQALAGGETRVQPDVLLSAGGGQISGVVSDGTSAVGGVTVTTSVGGKAVSVITPTTGAVGVYTLADLPTPGTYLISFSAEGFGTRSRIVQLGAGESKLQQDQSLASGTGSITGTVIGPDKQGLGGVSVSVGGAAAIDGSVPATTTLTDGTAAGTFVIDDLPTGTYALTFSKEGFAPVTLPVTLEDEGPGEEVRLQMGALVGTIRGLVQAPGENGQGKVGFVGATITATNGTTTNTATSSSEGGGLPQGGFLLPSLPPGWYSVTVTAPGRVQMTSLVEVLAGDVSRTTLFLEKGQ